MKEAYPVLVAENATAQEIIEEPAFAWWCPYVLRKRDRIIAGVKARVLKVGWKLCIEWRDGSTSLERLSEMKELYPVLVSKYATAQEIIEEPLFVWWCPYVLRKRDRIIAGVKARFLKKRFKYGFEVSEKVA